jgi:hypothetical protein
MPRPRTCRSAIFASAGRRSHALAAAAAALVSAAPPPAPDWWLLTTSKNPTVILYIDAASLEPVSAGKLVWLERVYETRSAEGAKRSQSRVIVDCARRLIGPHTLRSEDEAGRTMADLSATVTHPEMTPVPPGTVYEDVLSFVCDGKRSYDHVEAGQTPLSDSVEVFRILRARAS